MAELLGDSKDEFGGGLINYDSGDNDATYGSKPKKVKRGRKKRRGNKSRMFKGKPKPRREKIPPPDHLFKLPAEIRNRIYKLVLDPKEWHMEPVCKPAGKKRKSLHKKNLKGDGSSDEDAAEQIADRYYFTQEPKTIERGDEDEPALLWVCPQVREEARSIYYNLNSFILNVEVEQLTSLEKWISAIRTRFDCKDNGAFGGLTIDLNSLRWSQLASLLPLARINQVHYEYFQECDFWSKAGVRHRLAGVVQEVVKLGNKAGEEDWHEEWLGIKFEEWLEKKLDSVAARRRTGLANVEGMEVGLPGDWFGTDEPEVDDFDAPDFARGKKNAVGTSDRKLRSQA